jgi:hypothetical protein
MKDDAGSVWIDVGSVTIAIHNNGDHVAVRAYPKGPGDPEAMQGFSVFFTDAQAIIDEFERNYPF